MIFNWTSLKEMDQRFIQIDIFWVMDTMLYDVFALSYLKSLYGFVCSRLIHKRNLFDYTLRLLKEKNSLIFIANKIVFCSTFDVKTVHPWFTIFLKHFPAAINSKNNWKRVVSRQYHTFHLNIQHLKYNRLL